MRKTRKIRNVIGTVLIVVGIAALVFMSYKIYHRESSLEIVLGCIGIFAACWLCGKDIINSLIKDGIVDVKIIGRGETLPKRGGLFGGLLGLGAGGILGALFMSRARIGKSYPLTRFLIKYEDGSEEVKDYTQNSWESKELMKYVK